MNVIAVKRQMGQYAKTHKLPVPAGFTPLIPHMGSAAKELLKTIQAHAKIKVTGEVNRATLDVLFPLPGPFEIRHDYHAVHSSGHRPLSAVRLLVVHDMENADYLRAAENVGAYFEMKAAGGSTTFGIDNNSIQQYLDRDIVPWGAPGANTIGIHYENMGKASWPRKKWLADAQGTLVRQAYLLARDAKGLGIPLRVLTPSQARSQKGVITHAIATKAFGIAGGHTDPGSGYPLDWVMNLAKKYQARWSA